MIVARNVLELIGKTPMVVINKLSGPNSAKVLAKLEWYNIGGSIKDRMALYLIESAEAAGKLDRNKRILEATSGNTGIALALIASIKGYRTTIIMSETASIERRKLIKAYGAELILSHGGNGTGGARELKSKLLAENPDAYVDIDQFSNPANIRAHYETTGKEILEQTRGQLDAVVVGIGTAGTGVGTSMAVKEHDPEIKVIGVVPAIGACIHGLRNPEDVNPTALFDRKYFDEIVEIAQEEVPEVVNLARRAAREEGLFVGMSSAAIMHVAIRKAEEMGKGKTIVALLPDSGDKYLSTDLFE